MWQWCNGGVEKNDTIIWLKNVLMSCRCPELEASRHLDKDLAAASSVV